MLTQDFDWHATRSKRCRYLGESFSEELLLALIAFSMCVLETLRWCQGWFRRRSSVSQRIIAQQLCKAPPICDLAWYNANPGVRAAQYLSQVATGRADRLKLLWSRSYGSFEEFCEKEPAALRVFRISLEAAEAWLIFRLIVGSLQPPWLWAGTIDYRRPSAERVELKVPRFHRRHRSDPWCNESPCTCKVVCVSRRHMG